jgi:hypothetical protein
MIRTRVFATCLGCALLLGGAAVAQRPKENIGPGRHPNLAAAQRACQQAFDKISAAQHANEWDMQGHAQRAKELLEQASKELREAATAANHK